MDTLEFFPLSVKISAISSKEHVIIAEEELMELMENPSPPAPFTSFGDGQIQVFKALASLFSHTTEPRTTPSSQTGPARNQSRFTSKDAPSAAPRVIPPLHPNIVPSVTPHRYPTRQRLDHTNFICHLISNNLLDAAFVDNQQLI
jgi:hypothetical protein